MSIQSKALDTAVSSIYTATGADGNVMSVAYFCNRTGSAATFNLYLVQNGFTANANNVVYSSVTIDANDTYVMDIEKIILGNGDMIQANASVADSIVATVSTLGI